MKKTTATSSADKNEKCFQCADNPAIAGDGPDSGLCRPCMLAREALEAFWQVIARNFPDAKYGDLSPERTIRLHIAASTAISEWIRNNAEPEET